MNILQQNLAYIKTFNPRLVEQLVSLSDRISLEVGIQSSIGHSLSVDGERWFDNVEDQVLASAQALQKKQDRVLMQRINVPSDPKPVNQIISELIDSEEYVALNQLASLRNRPALKPRTHTTLLIGSLTLLQFPLNTCGAEHILLVEDDLLQLLATFSLIKLEDIVSMTRQSKKAFEFLLLHEERKEDHATLLLNHFGSKNPLALHGLNIVKSPKISPGLTQLHSWLHAPDGLLDAAKGFLGNDTDEMNQLLQALWSGLSLDANIRLIASNVISPETPIVLVASGPSLDSHINWLKKHQKHLTIFACGSALGALLRQGVRPTACILLEMASLVFRDVEDLIYEGYDLTGIALFASATVDPRLLKRFKSIALFHRPLSTAYAMYEEEQDSTLAQAGPQAANAGLEVALMLGSRNLLLLGCDFGTSDPMQPRASFALGESPRIFDLPSRGRLGKTIYSNAKLSTTAQLFSNALVLSKSAALSVGDGIALEGVHAVRSTDDPAVARFLETSHRLTTPFDLLPIRAVASSRLKEVLVEALAWGGERTSSITEMLSSSTAWSSELARQLGTLVSWDDKHLTAGRRVRHRLSRFLYFFVVQKLYDIQDPIQWEEEKLLVLDSLWQIKDLVDCYLEELIQMCRASALPDWDPAWIKQRFMRKNTR